MLQPRIPFASAVLALSAFGSAHAADQYPWRNHEPPLNFTFGNEIDAHQQTRLLRDGSLFGFFYIHFTGVQTKDRYPVATHVDCNANPDCTVGWSLNGNPISAAFLYHTMDDHPVFLAKRSDITQPGSPSHFHWLGSLMPMPRQAHDGFLLQLTAMERFCFIHHGAEAATPADTCQQNGGVNVDPGVDIATHLNIVASAPRRM